jgi:hypothetical protein
LLLAPVLTHLPLLLLLLLLRWRCEQLLRCQQQALRVGCWVV